MSWNIAAREMSPCKRAGSQHLDWCGDVPDSVGTVGTMGLAASSSHLRHCWQQSEAMGCHIPGGIPRAAHRMRGASSKGAMGRDVAACSQDAITHGTASS